MAEENKQHTTTTAVDVQDRGVFDFLGKKREEQKPQEDVIVTEFDNKVKVSDEPQTKLQEGQETEKKQSLLEKLHRSHGSSSSSSDEEEEGEGGEKKKKREKKGTKEKIGCGDHQEEKKNEDTAVPIEKVEVDAAAHPETESEEKKGILDKIKEKLPGQHNKAEEVPPTSSEYDAPHIHETHEGEANDKEKKGLLDKIKEKLPGYHTKPNEDKEKEIGTH